MTVFAGQIGLTQDERILRCMATAMPGQTPENFQRISRPGCHILVPTSERIHTLPLDIPIIIRNSERCNGNIFSISKEYFYSLPKNTSSTIGTHFAALAIDGGEQPTILLLVDRFGSRPLYYTCVNCNIYFSTSIPPLLAISSNLRQQDKAVFSSFAIFGCSVFDGRTPFSKIHSVPAGSCLKIYTDGTCKLEYFHRNSSIPNPGHGLILQQNELDDKLRALMTTAMRRTDDVGSKTEAGVFFSGGLDSTTILAFREQKDKASSVLFTQGSGLSGYESQEAPEDFVAAQNFATQHGWRLSASFLTVDQLERDIIDYIWHAALPMGGSGFDLLGGVAFHSLCREASGQVDVIHCGEGADELFMGYHQWHIAIAETRKRLCSCLNTMHPELRCWIEEKNLCGPIEHTAAVFRHLLLTSGLAGYHMPSVDASVSAFGLNAVMPFVDAALWDFITTLDESMFVDRRTVPPWTKLPLRRLLRAALPASDSAAHIALRRKRAMSYAATAVLPPLMQRCLGAKSTKDDFGTLLRRLYHALHIKPGFSTRPGLSIREILACATSC